MKKKSKHNINFHFWSGLCLLVAACLFILSSRAARSQDIYRFKPIDDVSKHKSYNININKDAFTVLIFPREIKQVSVSTNKVSAFVSDQQSNIVFVQTNDTNLSEPNLTILTKDHKLYNFVLDYKKSLNNFVYTIDKETVKVKDQGPSIKQADPKEDYNNISGLVLAKRNNQWNVSKKVFGIRLTLIGSYISGDTMFLKVKVTNTTKLKYDLDVFNLYARDAYDAKKRVAKTKMPIPILNIYPKLGNIGPRKSEIVVIAYKKVVIANKKSMFLDLAETNGDRSLTIPIRYNSIKNPTVLN